MTYKYPGWICDDVDSPTVLIGEHSDDVLFIRHVHIDYE